MAPLWIKAATAYPQHVGSNYPRDIFRVAQAIFQQTRVLCGYQFFGTHRFVQKLYEIRMSNDELPATLFNIDSEFSTVP